jgi:very-short-patch-repair endonuclease
MSSIQRLRRRQIDGFQFRRQFPIGPYFADFFCVHARLAIEVDGESHRGRERRDRLRDSFFRRRGIAVLRFTNQQIDEHPERVLDAIRAALRAFSPLMQRCRQAGGESARRSHPVARRILFSNLLRSGRPGQKRLEQKVRSDYHPLRARGARRSL